MPEVNVIGAYPFEAEEPVHLIEVQFHDLPGKFDLCGITQEWPGKDRKDWQVPYLEQILDLDGDSLLANWMNAGKKLELWQGNTHMVFFFHYLSFDRPLITPIGNAVIPREQELPARLKAIKYHVP